ncbi:MAG: hypothetical protein H6746_12290 [Deltaproteobacteria bacterium]|nr:hypothetical protein [Deltaproteobacteria bacterium]
MRPLRLLLASLLAVLCAGPARATLTPLAVLVDGAPEPLAVLLPYGMLERGADGGQPWLVCWQRFETASHGLPTGPRRILVGGADGPWNTNDDGCRFESTSGPADRRPVVGLHTPVPGGAEVLIAYDDGVAPASIARSTDGGITSLQAGTLAQFDASIEAMLGQGDVVWAVGRADTDGTLRVWRSVDRGAVFTPVDTSSAPADAASLEAAAAEDAALWFWRGERLSRLALDGQWSDGGLALPGTPRAALVSPDGALWAGTARAGLTRRAPDGSASQVSSLPVSALAARGAKVWAAHPAEAPGDPLVSVTGDLGASWAVSFRAPATVDQPPLCESLTEQRCAGALQTLLASLGVAAPAPDAPADASAEDGGAGGGSGGCGAAPGEPPWAIALAALLLAASGYASASRRSRIRASSSLSPRSAARSSAVTSA